MATLTLLPSADWLKENLKAAFRQGRPDLFGLSIDANGAGHMIESGGRTVLHVDSIDEVRSTDIVSFPAAKGGFVRLVASVAIHEAEAQTLQVVEALQQQMARLSFEMVLRETLDDLDISMEERRATRRRILDALPK